MGQKVHPYGLRLGYIKPWKSRWFSAKEFSKNLLEDLKIRKFLDKEMAYKGVSDIDIERSSKKMKIIISTARPGIVIGRRGSEIDRIRTKLEKFTNSQVFIDIKEIKNPHLDAQLVAQTVAQQIEKRVAFRRAMKKAVSMSMMKGAEGIKICCSGRLGGAEIARSEGYKEGKIPLSTFRADVDYGFTEAHTTYGLIGIKVWLYKGDVLLRKVAEEAKEAEEIEEKSKKGE